ncbi:MAG: hypothetical protein M1122_01230 [Candidatus Marsarchaeota archaeon]|nr:hypothetical protein [Candidatus Marsarchaeota archaeon]
MHDVDIDQELLDFAYRYPFSKEARELVSGVNDGFNGKYMREGKLRVEEALDRAIAIVVLPVPGVPVIMIIFRCIFNVTVRE